MRKAWKWFVCSVFTGMLSLPGADAALPAGPLPSRFERISIERGLSQSSVLCMLQDAEGYLWFGTEDGLNRWDGYSFTVFKNIPFDETSLSINTISDLALTKTGDLWIGTASGGVNRYDRGTGRLIRYRSDSRNPATLGSDGVQALAPAADGGLWVGTDTGGLNHLDPGTGACRRYTHDPRNPRSICSDKVFALCPDPSGALWVGTNQGLDRLDPSTGIFTHFRPDPRNPGSLRGSRVRALRMDRAGRLWAGTEDGGLNRIDPRTGMVTRVGGYSATGGPLDVRSIREDRFGGIWIGTWDDGLGRFDPGSGSWTWYRHDPSDPESLGGDIVLSLHEDAAGNIFAGTAYCGLSVLPHNGLRFSHLQHEPGNPRSLSGSHVWSVLEDRDGILWAGTMAEGLNRIDRERNAFTCFRHDPGHPGSIAGNTILVMYEDRAGALWLGTDGKGLDRFDRRTGRSVHFRHTPPDSAGISSNYIWAILEDRAGEFWVGTAGGLDRFDRTTGKCVHFRSDPADPGSLSSKYITCLYETRGGEFWVGTAEGLNRMDRKTGRCTRYLYDPHKPHGLNYNRIWCLHEDRAGNLWIGTWGGGLNRFDRATDTFEHFTESDGLVNNTVYGILEDGAGALWLSTNRGLSRFDPRTRSFRNFTSRDGLRNEEFNVRACFRNSGGEMFFGGIHGLTAFRPEDLTEDPYAPPVVITSFRAGSRPVSPAYRPGGIPEVRLKYDETNLSFEFSSLDYTAPGRNRYSYKLEGFDRDWVHSGSRRYAGYTRLGPGEYTFRVRGTNADGKWSTKSASVRILVAPPFWGTWWFRVLAGLSLAGLVFGIHLIRVSRIRARGRILERIVRERTESLRSSREEIARQEELYRSLVETSPDAIVMTDTVGKIITANPRAALLFGCRSVRELLERDFGELTGAQAADAEEATAVPPGLPASRGHREITVIGENGEKIPAELNSAPVRDENGTVRHRIYIIRDISERKRAEDERIERERLNGIIELAGSACHELNQPLQAIVGYSELMMLHRETEDDFLRRIITEVHRLRGITHKLQNITRYRTKPYYGGERILDLDKASGDGSPEPPDE